MSRSSAWWTGTATSWRGLASRRRSPSSRRARPPSRWRPRLRLYDELVSLKADRHTAVVALGGGVIGDLAGFVAATYARGVPLVMVPTTLLAQVDSSVGGKVGVNHPGAKNIIGAFHQPSGVWIDTETLRTLPDRELRCGMAEVVKYGVILDGAFFDELEGSGRGDPGARRPGAAADRRPELPAQGVGGLAGRAGGDRPSRRAELRAYHRPCHRGGGRLRGSVPARGGRGRGHGGRGPPGGTAGLDRGGGGRVGSSGCSAAWGCRPRHRGSTPAG